LREIALSGFRPRRRRKIASGLIGGHQVHGDHVSGLSRARVKGRWKRGASGAIMKPKKAGFDQKYD